MDSRVIVIILVASLFLLLPVYFIWTYRSGRRFTERQKQVEAELLMQKEMLDDVREELNQLKKERVYSGDLDEYQSYEFISGVAYIDILLADKQKTCVQKGIDFACLGSQWPDMNHEQELMIRLLGNLLDNAIEAAEKADDEKKHVKIESHILKGQWVLIVTNSKSPSERPLEHGMKTTKADPAVHGMGTRIIDKTVKRLGGFVKRIDEGELFKVRVTIPVED